MHGDTVKSWKTILIYLHDIMGRICHNRQMNKWTVNRRCIFRQYSWLSIMCYIYLKPSSGAGIEDSSELIRQAMYVKRNNEARSWSYCCSGKAIRITYSECVFVALFIQNANLMRRHYNIFVFYLINGKNRSYWT